MKTGIALWVVGMVGLVVGAVNDLPALAALGVQVAVVGLIWTGVAPCRHRRSRLRGR